MDVRFILAAAIAASAPVQAQQVHKCIEGGKAVYQSQPCTKGEPLRSWSARVEPRSYEAELADRRIEVMRQQNAARSNQRERIPRRQGVVIRDPQHKNPSRCEAAKAHRDSVYRAAGLKRSFQLSRTMDDQVYEACK